LSKGGAAPPKPNEIERLFGRRHALVGMIHLWPLPGAPRYDAARGVEPIYERALSEGHMLESAGFDGVIVENGGDAPFLGPNDVSEETTTTMAVAVSCIVRELHIPVGVNCLGNAAGASIAIAQAAGGRFVRANQWVNAYVANEGFVEGRAGRVTRYRRAIGADGISVWADVAVKLGSHAITADRSIAEQARDAEFFDADALIVTGSRLADPPMLKDILEVRKGCDLAVVIGSGAGGDNLEDLFAEADAAIVGSSLKHDGVWWNDLSPVAIERVVAARDAVAQG
jgi:membrane complex biogenesis BtpA family protein